MKEDAESFVETTLTEEVAALRERLERLEEYVLGVLRARHERPKTDRSR